MLLNSVYNVSGVGKWYLKKVKKRQSKVDLTDAQYMYKNLSASTKKKKVRKCTPGTYSI